MDKDRIVKIGARALAEESTGVLWDQMTSGQKAAEIARSKRECRAALAAFEEAGLVVEQGWRFDMENAPTETMILGYGTLHEPGNNAGETPNIHKTKYMKAYGGWVSPEVGSWHPVAWRPFPVPPAAKADPQ